LVFNKRWRIGLLGALVSLLAIYVIVSQINFSELRHALSVARYGYLLPCIALLLAGLVARAYRWRALLSDALPIGRAFSIMNVAYLVNNVLPLRIGELARVYLATRYDPPVPVFKTLSTVIVERLLDLLAVVLMLAFALATGSVPNELRAAGTFAAPAALGGFLFLVFLASRRSLAQQILIFFTSRFTLLERLNLSRWLNHFLDGLMPLIQPQALGQVFLWTLISWGFSIAAGYILMFAFFESASVAATCLYIAAAALAIAVPAIPGNIGTYETSIVFALAAMGYGEPVSTAVAFAVVVHGVNVVVHAATGIIGFIQEGISLERLSQGVQEMRQHTS
jgi:glycosyltransferase 2 family protein